MSKYKAVKTEVDGIVFDSKKEAARYGQLKLLVRAGHIKNLTMQTPLPVSINGVKIFTYKPDFIYNEDGNLVIEDCKGFRTDVYRLKKKAIEAAYSIKIRET